VWGLAATASALLLYLIYHGLAQAAVGAAHSYQLLSGENGVSVFKNIQESLNAHKKEEQAIIYQVFQFLWFAFAYGVYRLYRERGLRSELLLVSAYLLGAVMFGRLFAANVDRVYVMMAPLVLAVSAAAVDNLRSQAQRGRLRKRTFEHVKPSETGVTA
jgi:hypothetical protein